MLIFIRITISILIILLSNISLTLAETPEEKGLRLAIEADLTGEGFIAVSYTHLTLPTKA